MHSTSPHAVVHPGRLPEGANRAACRTDKRRYRVQVTIHWQHAQPVENGDDVAKLVGANSLGVRDSGSVLIVVGRVVDALANPGRRRS
jgi:hypothetical protein